MEEKCHEWVGWGIVDSHWPVRLLEAKGVGGKGRKGTSEAERGGGSGGGPKKDAKGGGVLGAGLAP